MDNDEWTSAASILRVANQLVDGIQDGVRRRGFDDVRPAHGFAFVLLSAGDVTTTDLARHLGITKQGAAQLIAHLVERGYVERQPDPEDRRARRLVLTEHGWACTRAAEEAAAETIAAWRGRLGPSRFRRLHEALDLLAEPGPIRPTW